MRFGVIGIGVIGPVNVRALMAQPEAEIAAIANRTVSKAQDLCDTLGINCPIFSDWREMLSAAQLDAVLIQLYNDMHYECFLECARRGLDILVEKPLANRYEDCQEMMEAAAANGIKAMVLQTQRYGSVLQTAKAYMREHKEELGQLLCINDQEGCNYFHDTRSAWHLDPVRSGGGIVLNYGVHQLDRVHWLLEQKTVRFHAKYLMKKPGIHTYSSYTMMGVTEGDVPYVITSNGYCDPWVNEILLSFERGVVKCQIMDGSHLEKGVYVGNNATGQLNRIPAICVDGEGNHEMYCRQMREALDYLTGVTDQSPISLEWGAEMVRLCQQGFAQ